MLNAEISIEAEIRTVSMPGKVKAYADVRLSMPDGTLQINGCSVIHAQGKDPWIGFPSTRGSSRYFPVVEVDGLLKRRIIEVILEAYRNSQRS